MAPDLVVEVKSPGNSNPEMAAKADVAQLRLQDGVGGLTRWIIGSTLGVTGLVAGVAGMVVALIKLL